MAAGLAVMVERKRLTRDIRSEARRLGFAATGIARVEPLPAAQRLDAWLAGGMHGAMAYMGRQAERRKNPALVLENARSLLVLGFSYHTDDLFKEEPLKGRISRYAWGGDYHELIRPRLERLREFILSRAPGTRGVSYVDTGPVMEKAWGAASSLGWIGRHSNLVSREMGSWFFIGVVLLDLELEYDSPARDYCGSCARCIPACPTSAIVAPYVVDARLCISYLTIEFRGIIPPALRPLMGNRIFGCDDCLEVCPWNRFARPTAEAQFRPRKDLLMPELTSLVSISARDFSVRFRHSAVRRAQRTETSGRRCRIILPNIQAWPGSTTIWDPLLPRTNRPWASFSGF